VCGFPLPRNVAAVQTIAEGWIRDAFTGSHTGLYGAPGQLIKVDGATVQVLPYNPVGAALPALASSPALSA
jgi:hypothetical protein